MLSFFQSIFVILIIETQHCKPILFYDKILLKILSNKGEKTVISLGLDSGSSMTKVVLLEDDHILQTKMIPTSISPRRSLEELYQEMIEQNKEIDVTVTTGYGRNLLDCADYKITEITCHAAGAFFMNKNCDTIIDIGGQDSKVITIDDLGFVTDFLMNDKCAAGTGRFLEMTMKRVESEIDTFVKDATPAKINSMCAVFAESEIVGLLAQDVKPGDIVLGCVESICQRTAAFAQKLAPENPNVFFSGGLASFEVIRQSLAKHLGIKQVITDPLCQYTGAIGAAVLGIRKHKR